MTKVSERANLVGSIIGQADLGSGPEVELSRFPKRFGRYLPVRASQWTQPIMRDLALAMSFALKKSSGLTLSTG